MNRFTLHHGDSREVLKTLAEASVDSIVCDPPYHLTTGKKGGTGPASVNLENPYGRARVGTGFMGMKWDGGDIAHDASFWAECLRVAKPGAYLAAFGGSRTFHRLACAIEDAGWELRDTPLRGHTPQPEDCPWLLAWAYGSGFPKSHNGEWGGTALKPAWEPIVLARKPLIGTVEENWREHGTGALNIDACRIAPQGEGDYAYAPGAEYEGRERQSGFKLSAGRLSDIGRWPANLIHDGSPEVLARFPSEAGASAPVRGTESSRASVGRVTGERDRVPGAFHADTGSAARFFASFPSEAQCHSQQSAAPTVAQTSSLQSALAASVQSAAAIWPSLAGIVSSDSAAPSTNVTASESRTVYEIATATMATLGSGCSREQRHEKRTPNGSLVSVAATSGPTGTTTITASLSKSDGSVERVTFTITPTNVDRGEADSRFRYCAKASKKDRGEGNAHPTVKPTDLMRWLIRLVTPAGGLVLDPFMGSGSTGKAAMLEGMRFVGIDLTADYIDIARARIDFAARMGHQPSLMEVA